MKKEMKRYIVLLMAMAIIGTMIYNFNKKDIKEQEQTRQGVTKSIQTEMYTDTIREKFNELKSYKVLDGVINMQHTYNYEKETVLGLKKKVNITAFADIYYEFNIDLRDVDIKEAKDKIIVKVDYPYLDQNTINIKPNSTKVIDSKTSSNMLANKEDNRIAMQYFSESLVKVASRNIDRLYGSEKKNHLEYNCKKEVRKLVETFVDKDVEVEFK